MSVVTARAFNQSPSLVKAMVKDGPVFVTDRGKPSIVILDADAYERLVGARSLRDSLRMDVDFEFEPVISLELGGVAEL